MKQDTKNELQIRGHPFSDRNSYFENIISDDGDKKSIVYGFRTLMGILFFSYFLFTTPILKYISNDQQIISDRLFTTFKHEFFLCMSTWPIFYVWSYSAFILQKLVIMGMPTIILSIFQHLTQSAMFIFSIYMVLSHDWCVTHTLLVTLLVCVFFMKMHSYTMTNLLYRKDWLQKNNNKNGEKAVSNYPNNINLKDFTLYLWIPVLVYQYKYPMRDKIRVGYVLMKGITTLILITIAYIIACDYLIPIMEQCIQLSWYEQFLKLMYPFFIFNFIIFVIVFENIVQFFAEISKFGDRQFYQDWWNSTSYEEFNRKWNRPVHEFLFRHVYQECIENYKTSKGFAQFVTFLFSAFLHEMVMTLVVKEIRPILLAFMIFQIPLFYLSKPLQGKIYGNILFWSGQVIGPSLIIVSYLHSSTNIQNRFCIQQSQFQ